MSWINPKEHKPPKNEMFMGAFFISQAPAWQTKKMPAIWDEGKKVFVAVELMRDLCEINARAEYYYFLEDALSAWKEL